MRRAIGYIVDASGRRPLTVLAIVLCVLAVTWHFALKVLSSPHTDLRELLPTDSPGLKAFEHQLGRVGGGATLLVVVESPDRADNERFADDLGRRLQAVAASEGAAGLVAYVESGTKDVHAFFEKNKWLYADESDLRAADEEIDRQIALRSGMVEDLEGGGAPAKPALGVEDHRERWSERARRLDDFPGGYFETADGAMVGLRIVSRTTGMGDAGGDRLLGEVQRVVAAMRPESYHPAMRVGFAGDIPNAAAEKRSIVSQAAWASGVALLLIAAGVVWFYGSVWSLPVIALPALLGVGAAYAFAYFRFGYVNTTGMFLGAIILGNGVNYPIVLLARYREFVARGVPP
ncbi:MAG TPA: MMPL family transporter, partial [Polyangiaceae bacterium]|nr:MMPL family transporter [Polyangiaceae bacterium]